MKMQYPSSGPAGRGQFGNRISSGGLPNEPGEGATFNQFIGRKVRTRWPDDNNFYEAVITDYNAAEVGLIRDDLLTSCRPYLILWPITAMFSRIDML